jgi:uncharacterized Ntn-hydrolase superfamily protein
VALVVRAGTALVTDLLIQLRARDSFRVVTTADPRRATEQLRAVGRSGKLADWLAGPDRPRPRP